MRSGTGGPCNHCGRTSSPCWRKGPPDKPLLCNACGARFLVKKSLDGYLPATRDHKLSKLAHVQYTHDPRQPQPSSMIGTQRRKESQGQGTGAGKRKRYATPRYDVDDLYVREAKYDYKAAKGSSCEAKRSTSDSSASSATAAEQSDEKSTVESESKRLRLMFSEPLHKIDVNNVAASAAIQLMHMDHLNGMVTALVRRRRKQSHPLCSSVH